jgi:ABC-2 type transport system permease protein
VTSDVRVRNKAEAAELLDSSAAPAAGGPKGFDLRYFARTVRVLAGAEYKLKYSGSVLGYFWTLGKPLALFSVLYVVFQVWLRFGGTVAHFPLYLLLGLLFFYFFGDGTGTTMGSLVARRDVIRRLAFPRATIPVAVTVTALLTFAGNLVAAAVFVAWNRIVPQVDWLLLIPLLAELYVFVLGVALILATLFVVFRDLRQIWDVVIQGLLYATPIIYPVQLLPAWAQKLVLLSPLAQVIQDVRRIVLGPTVATTASVYGTSGIRLVPLGITGLTLVVGIVLFRWQQSWFPERV